MLLEQLIERLEKEPQDKVIKNGFGKAMSYRGDYSELAFEPVNNVTVGSMLEEAKYALDGIYEWYKGEDLTMHKHTKVYIIKYKYCRDELSKPSLENMLADVV